MAQNQLSPRYRQPHRSVRPRLPDNRHGFPNDIPSNPQRAVSGRRLGNAERGAQAKQRRAFRRRRRWRDQSQAAPAPPPAIVPARIARKVEASISPFPATSSRSAKWSGSIPYLNGPNIVACTPSPNSTASSPGTLPVRNAQAARPISSTSAALVAQNQARFVEPVRDLSRRRRQQGIRRDEQRPSQGREARSAGTLLEDGKDDHRVLDQVVVECPASLGHAQRAEAAGEQQGVGHSALLACFRDFAVQPSRLAQPRQGRRTCAFTRFATSPSVLRYERRQKSRPWQTPSEPVHQPARSTATSTPPCQTPRVLLPYLDRLLAGARAAPRPGTRKPGPSSYPANAAINAARTGVWRPARLAAAWNHAKPSAGPPAAPNHAICNVIHGAQVMLQRGPVRRILQGDQQLDPGGMAGPGSPPARLHRRAPAQRRTSPPRKSSVWPRTPLRSGAAAGDDELPLGRRQNWPIYEAAEAHGLPIGIHAGSSFRHPPSALGWPSYYLEDYVSQAQGFAAALNSLVGEGVFVEVPQPEGRADRIRGDLAAGLFVAAGQDLARRAGRGAVAGGSAHRNRPPSTCA